MEKNSITSIWEGESILINKKWDKNNTYLFFEGE